MDWKVFYKAILEFENIILNLEEQDQIASLLEGDYEQNILGFQYFLVFSPLHYKQDWRVRQLSLEVLIKLWGKGTLNASNRKLVQSVLKQMTIVEDNYQLNQFL